MEQKLKGDRLESPQTNQGLNEVNRHNDIIRDLDPKDLDLISIEKYLNLRFSILNKDEYLEVTTISKKNGGIDSYIFNKSNYHLIFDLIDKENGKSQIYLSVNRCKELNYEKQNRMKDNDVLKRDFIYIDIDAIRQPINYTEIKLGKDLRRYCVTDSELNNVKKESVKVLNYLKDIFGVVKENLIIGFTGNGISVLINTDLPCGKESDKLHKEILEHLKSKFNSDFIDIDTSVQNKGRITKLLGVKSLKLESPLNGRLNKVSKIISSPDKLTVYDTEKMKSILNAEFKSDVKEELNNEKTNDDLSVWSRIKMIQLKNKKLNRTLPDIDFLGNRLNGSPCPICGQSGIPCLSGTHKGDDWALCWDLSTKGTEGIDCLFYNTGFGPSHFYWVDGTPVYTLTPELKIISEGEDKEKFKEDREDVNKNIKNTKYLPSMRDGLLKEIGEYLKAEFAYDKSDASALSVALSVISHMNHNVFNLSVSPTIKSKLNTWFLLIGDSAVGKTDLYNKVRKIHDDVIEEVISDKEKIKYYKLKYTSKFTEEGFLLLIQDAPYKQVLFRADEFARFYDNKELSSQIDFFLQAYSGLSPSTAYVKNKKENGTVINEVQDFQFNLLAQSTSDWLFTALKKRPDDLVNGFYGRFVTIIEELNVNRKRELKTTQLKESLINPDLIAPLYSHVPDGEEWLINYDDKINYIYGEIIKKCALLWQEIDKQSKTCPKFYVHDETQFFYLYDEIEKAIDVKNNSIHRAIINRMYDNVPKIASIIELSHLIDDDKTFLNEEEDELSNILNQGMDNNIWKRIGNSARGIKISRESYIEAFNFVSGETLKWLNLIDGSMGETYITQKANKILSILERHYDKNKKEYEVTLDKTSFKIYAIPRNLLKKKAKLDTKEIEIGLQDLQDSGIIEIYSYPYRGNKGEVISWGGKR